MNLTDFLRSADRACAAAAVVMGLGAFLLVLHSIRLSPGDVARVYVAGRLICGRDG